MFRVTTRCQTSSFFSFLWKNVFGEGSGQENKSDPGLERDAGSVERVQLQSEALPVVHEPEHNSTFSSVG